MPRLTEISKMKDEVVLAWLCMLPTSMFNGLTARAIDESCNRSEARRYLNELVLLNDRNKSQLFEISEIASSRENCSIMPDIENHLSIS